MAGTSERMCARRAFGPWQVRRFRRWTDRLWRLAPWLWFGGLAVVALAGFLSGGDRWWIRLACALTVYPALFIWIGLPAVEGLWKLFLRAPVRTGPSAAGRLGWLVRVAVCIVFLAVGLAPLLVTAWHLLALP